MPKTCFGTYMPAVSAPGRPAAQPSAQLKTRFPSPSSPFSSPSRRTRLKAKRASGAGSSSCSCARTLARMSPRAASSAEQR